MTKHYSSNTHMIHNFLSSWLFLVYLFANVSQADDIDIYTTITGSNSNNTANHNILFVMDTSGSMNSPVAGLATGGDYDPNTDYGNSADKIYVYDTNFSFTGITIENSQNVCQSMTDVFNTSTSYPVYLDQTVQWQQTTDIIDGGQTCVPGSGGTNISGSNSYNNDKNQWKLVDSISVSPGDEFDIDLSTNKKLWFYVGSNNNGGGSYYTYCYKSVGNNSNSNCSDTVVSGDNNLDIWVQPRTKSATNISYSGTVGTGSGEVCTDNPDTTITTSDWKSSIISSSDPTTVLECRNDANYHGLSDSSADLYVEDCGYSNTCVTPNYTSTANDEINWNTSANRYFLPANYHDFLLNIGNIDSSDILNSPQDADTYCNSSNRIGDIFIDTDTGLIFECFKRIDVMKTAVNNMVSSLTSAPINVGLMRFNSSGNGGTVIDAVQSISNNTDFSTKLNGLSPNGGTPLSEVLYESYLYYSASAVSNGQICTGSTCTDTSAYSGGRYNSPITDACQSNNIIFLSDGEPSGDGGRDTQIKALAGVSSCGDVGGSGKCLDEAAGAMATKDISSVAGTNTVKTYTIGLDIDLPLLEDTAEEGNGEYFIANNTVELQAAFQDIVLDILTDSSTFVAPAVSVNAFNELQHRNEIYYALFEPSGTPRWPGNVKKYSVSSTGEVLDVNNQSAIDPLTGFFKETAQSAWSSSIDGRTVTVGGVVEQLTNTRNVYTENDTGAFIKLSNSNLNTISASTLNTGSDAERDNILSWLLGIDRYDDNRNNNFTEAAKFLGDPLHSRPFVITYGGNSSAPEDVLFFTTNLGTLHAVDPADHLGTELWSYIPEEHLDNPKSYIEAPNSTTHVYGLDGELTVVTEEATGSTSSNFSLESVKLFFGERRGGSRYYGMDASNARINATPAKHPDNSHSDPVKPLWKITGALHGNNAETVVAASADNGFKDLAQTWSKMEPTELKSSGIANKKVLIFSGGYDPAHDDISYESTSTVSDYGNAIYIVDQDTGALVFSIGNNDDDDDPNRDVDDHKLNLNMRDSIPSSPTIVDLDGDGAVDILFAVDILGHVWRVDFDHTKDINSADYVKGGMIADLSDDSHTRRFYNSVDVSRSNRRTGSDHLNIVVGSGYRASPAVTETWNNRLHILFDRHPIAPTLDTNSEEDRYNYFIETDNSRRLVTADDLDLSTRSAPKSIASSPNGIYIEFSSSEKILQSSTTFNSVVVVSSFNPNETGSNACGGGLGAGRVYVLDLNTGLSVLPKTDDQGNAYLNVVSTDDGSGGDGSGGDGSSGDGSGGDGSGGDGSGGDGSGGDGSGGDGSGGDGSGGDGSGYNGNDYGDYYSLEHQGIPADITLLLLPKLAVCIGTECDIDPIEEAILNGFETGQAYRTFWREEEQ